MPSIFAKKVYTNSSVFEDQTIYTDQGRIIAVEPGPPVEAGHSVDCLSAAFIDLQVNGGREFNFTEQGNVASIRDINDECAGLGTGYMLPTIISSPQENILRAIEAIKRFQQRFPGSGVLGMHLEGPFINPEKRGAHPLAWVRRPSNEELNEIIHYGKGVIRLMTIAPEVFTDPQMDLLLNSGITIAAGHSNATYKEAIHAFDRGIRLVTHLFNAMSPFLARSPGLVGAAFDTPDVATPMILDGIHSDFSTARTAYKIKREKLFFISDALFVGKKKKRYQWGDFTASLREDQYVNDEGHFAGSTISLGDAVRNAVFEAGISLTEAISMVTQRPAEAIDMDKLIGSVMPGYPALFTVFDASLHEFHILRG